MTPGDFFYSISPFLRLKIIKLCGSYFLRCYGSVIFRLGLNPIILECCQILSVFKVIEHENIQSYLKDKGYSTLISFLHAFPLCITKV